MLILVSPSKTLDYQSPLSTKEYTQPELLSESKQLIKVCQKLTASDLMELMSISDKLAELNEQRFKDWQPKFTLDNARQAVLAFKGDVYEGLNVDDFTKADFAFAQNHLRILSGLYGVLRPLDLIQPYRLEMGIRLKNTKGNNLYQFWGDKITKVLNNTLAEQNSDLVVNLASDEYFKAVQVKQLSVPIIKPVFLDEKKGQYKVISFYAKKARGLMSRFIIKHQITDSKTLQEFNLEGYQFDKTQSGNKELVFKRSEQHAK
ncbi:peroxide stress protein YaaA [Zophobihabitans entericus]|uniref:UPF0246 protein IPMB12_09595 n=1 Tax=Zophobihabitans entericus TaxID=1635327 RepID=A0A6G9IDJ2_9GAMM|nr:peroxide stress protein YaaA [Zophobihabitans entericus]QIQ21907.1 peroxide stress protein YaaA [Zophobihabitans entericus]